MPRSLDIYLLSSAARLGLERAHQACQGNDQWVDSVMAGACPGHPRLRWCSGRNSWMPGTGPGTTGFGYRRQPQSMRTPRLTSLFATVRSLKGVGPKVESLLNKLVAPRHEG